MTAANRRYTTTTIFMGSKGDGEPGRALGKLGGIPGRRRKTHFPHEGVEGEQGGMESRGVGSGDGRIWGNYLEIRRNDRG